MKKALALVLSVLMVILCIPAYALELDLPETSIETTEMSAEASLSAATAFTEPTTGEYGKLIWAADFEGAKGDFAYDASFASPYAQNGKTAANWSWATMGCTATIETDPTNDSNKVLKITQPSGYEIFYIDFPSMSFSKPGKYTFTYDFYHDGTSKISIANGAYVNGCNVRPDFYTENSTAAWTVAKPAGAVIRNQEMVEAEFGPDKATYSYNSTSVVAANSPLYYSHQYYIFISSGSAQRTGYIDNVKIWYEEYGDITFHLDSVPEVTSDIAAASMPNNHRTIAPGAALPLDITVGGAGKKLIGWKTGDGTPVTTATAGKYDLYAIYEDDDTFNYTATGSEYAKADGTGSYFVNATLPMDWTIDLGNTDATLVTKTAGTVNIKYGKRAGVITIHGVDQNNEENVIDKTIILYGSTVTTPGLNLINGLTTPVTFDDGYTYGFGDNGDKTVTIADVPSVDYAEGALKNESGKAIAQSWSAGANAEAYRTIYFHSVFEKGRKYTVQDKFYNDCVAGGITGASGWLTTFISGVAATTPNYGYTSMAQSWKTMSYAGTYTYAATNTSTTHQLKVANKGDAAQSGTMYYDDCLIMPWYNITYHFVDDSTETVVYDPTKTTYTIDAAKKCADYGANGKFYTFKGWAESKDAEEAVTEVALKYYDVDLYPVFEEVSLLTCNVADQTVKAGGTISVSTPAASTITGWTVDLGNATDSTVAYSDENRTATVTAGAYSGEITLQANFESGETPAITVAVVGGSKWRPGLNVTTGTTKAFDATTTTAKKGLSVDGVVVSNPNPSGINTTEGAVRYTSQYARIYNASSFSPYIELERPVEFDSDFLTKGATGDFSWLMINTSSSDDIYANPIMSSTDGKWSHVNRTVRVSSNSKIAGRYPTGFYNIAVEVMNIGTFSDTNNLWLDNMSWIPWYKITYVDTEGTELSHTYVLWEDETTKTKLLETYIPTGYPSCDYLIGGVKVNDGVKLANEDITITVKTNQLFVFKGANADETKEIIPEDATFTVPSPESLGFTTTNFIAWSVDGKKVNVGDTITAADYYSKSFNAFYQDATKPAMGYAFEGSADGNFNAKSPAAPIGSYTVLGYTTDADGRTVWQLAYNKTGVKDARSDFMLTSAINPAEYTMFEYSFKVDSDKASTPGRRMFYQFDGNYWGSHTIGGVAYSGEYTVKDLLGYSYNEGYEPMKSDLSASGNASNLWANPNANFQGFHIDLTNGDVDTTKNTVVSVDYLRVYRKGLTTVSYYDGDTLLWADEGRGVGTGYILSTEPQTKAGVKFLGWSLTKGGEVVKTIDLTGDISVYAVWTEAPTALTSATEIADKSVGGADYRGIRFGAKISDTLYNLNGAEFGFIVTRKAILDALSTEAAAFTTEIGAGKYVKGVAIDKANGVDLVRSVDDTTGDVTFSAFIYNSSAAIPEDEVIVARPYMLYDGVTLYGEAMSKTFVNSLL